MNKKILKNDLFKSILSFESNDEQVKMDFLSFLKV